MLIHEGRVVVSALRLACRFHERLLGYMGQTAPRQGCGLYLTPCRAIHTWFMRFALDVIILDRQLGIVDIVHAVPPWHMLHGGNQACGIVEIPAGTISLDGLRAGDTLSIRPTLRRHGRSLG